MLWGRSGPNIDPTSCSLKVRQQPKLAGTGLFDAALNVADEGECVSIASSPDDRSMPRTGTEATGLAPQVVESIGEPRRNRTFNLRIN